MTVAHCFITVLALVLSLLCIIGFHEAGHAVVAYFFNIKIERVSIGFGKVLCRWKLKAHCEWVWSLWPLGGYVHLLNSRIKPVSAEDYPYCFDKQSAWARCLVLLSGSFANCLIAYLALLVSYSVDHFQLSPTVSMVKPHSIAAHSGLTSGDHITVIDGHHIASWHDVGMQLLMNVGHDDVPITVERADHRIFKTSLSLGQWRYHQGDASLLSSIGLEPERSLKNSRLTPGLTFSNAFYEVGLELVWLSYFYLVMIKLIMTGAIPFFLLLGPVGFLTELTQAFFQGWVVFLSFIANLSIAVGLVNLFPIPGLDGGGIVYVLIEKCRGKPISVALEVLIYRLSSVVFFLFFVHLISNDLQRFLAHV